MCYNPNRNLTVDEQLLPCKTRCKFIQYMPNKPDKFGIKFWLLAELDSKYVLNGFSYLGKEEERPNDELQGSFVVKKLVEPYYNRGHNVTTDQFFTSYDLALDLLAKKTTLVGTVNKNRKYTPKITGKQELHSSKFFENEKGVLVTIYQCKPSKQVTLLSTLHEKAEISEDKSKNPNCQKKKPSIITYYNGTKCGVDSVDQMTRNCSVKYPTRRWPVGVWNNTLNLGGINSWILYKDFNKCKIMRRNYITKFIDEIKEYITEERIKHQPRLDNQEAPSTPTTAIKKRKADQQTPKQETPKAAHCQVRMCGNNKAIGFCVGCEKSVCGRCVFSKELLCRKCSE